MIKKSYYNLALKYVKIDNICPKGASLKFEKKEVRIHNPQIASPSFNRLSYLERNQTLYKQKLLMKSDFNCLFQKGVHYIMMVSHTP